MKIIVVDDLNFVESLIFSLISIIVVFAILTIAIGCIHLTRYVTEKLRKKEKQDELVQNERAKLSIEDITDEDMMVAALIATIDYAGTIKQDVRLVSIKQIN